MLQACHCVYVSSASMCVYVSSASVCVSSASVGSYTYSICTVACCWTHLPPLVSARAFRCLERVACRHCLSLQYLDSLCCLAHGSSECRLSRTEPSVPAAPMKRLPTQPRPPHDSTESMSTTSNDFNSDMMDEDLPPAAPHKVHYCAAVATSTSCVLSYPTM